MKCIVCNSEAIVEKDVIEEIKVDNNIIFIPIKTLECDSCGERYYNKQTLKKLEDIEKKLNENQIELKEVGKVLLAS